MTMFRSRRQEAISRRWRSALAIIALILAMTGLAGWLAMRYYLSGAARPPENSEASSTPVEDIPAETASSLLILGDPGQERFLLVQFAPADDRISVLPLPATMDDGSGQAITTTLLKNGASRVRAVVEAVLGLPVSHYLHLDTEAVEEYLNYLEGSVTVELPETVKYTDENGGKVQLSNGERLITAGQAGALLRYTGWSKASVGDTVAARLVCGVLNRFMQPDHRFDGDFAALANVAQTDIRINHYNAYTATLVDLASGNTGDLAQVVSLTGTTEGGLFRPDVAALRAETPLYAQVKEDEE